MAALAHSTFTHALAHCSMYVRWQLLQFRGGKKATLPVGFESLLPIVRVIQPEFNFGGVCASQRTALL